MTDSGQIHIGIVTYNSLPDISRCLASLHYQTATDWKLHIYDNNSQDGTVRWLRRYAETRPELELSLHLASRNAGYGAGHNAIIASIDWQPDMYYLALNPDAILTATCLERLRSELVTRPAFGWAGGKLLRDATTLYSAGHAMTQTGYAFNIGQGLPADTFNQTREVFGVNGAAVLIKQPLLDDLAGDDGVFDASFFFYGEDTDFDWRARCRGWRCLWVADAIAYHRGSRATSRQADRAVINRYSTVMKCAPRLALIGRYLPLMLLHLLARLLLTPRRGWQMLTQAREQWPRSYRRRCPCRTDVTSWLASQSLPPANLPRTLPERICAQMCTHWFRR